MFALLAVYFTWFAPDPPPPIPDEVEQLASQEELIVKKDTPTEMISQQTPDSLVAAEKYLKYGAFAFATGQKEKTLVVENEELKISFSNIGGGVKEVILKKHNDYFGNPFVLVDENKSDLKLIVDHQGKRVNLSELEFSSSKEEKDDTTYVSYTLKGNAFSVKQQYAIPKSGFQIGYKISSSGLNSVLNPTDISLEWIYAVNRAERNIDDSRYNTNVRYYLASEEYDELAQRSTEFEEETLGSQIKWVAFKQKFFTAAVIANTAFNSGYVNQKVNFADTTSVKDMAMNLTIPYSEFLNGFGYTYYFGTNNYGILKKVAPDFEENLDMGWGPLPLVNKYLIIPIFHFLERFMSNYGLIIMVIVILIRLMLSPLTYKSHMSMAKMRVMKPELDEIKAKHEGDMQKTQQEQMKLYQQVGINPLSGCIPMLLQMPILFSLFFFFPNAVELRGEAFLWATDLSTYDSVLNLPFEIPFYGSHVSLFTLLMTASTILYTWSNSQITTVQGPMKTLQYIMPIMFLFVLNSYASGLTFYYFVSNMATFGQTVLFRKFIDEDKIHSILQENKKKNVNKKKSKFQTRLEDAMKANQQAQKKDKKKK